MDAAFVEIYRSARRGDCEERALVLTAVGIECELERVEHGFVLLVAEGSVSAALAHLDRYREESLVPAPRPAPLALHQTAWLGAAAYVVILVSIARAALDHWFGADWLAAGELAADRVKAGQWWRLITALTLHVDAAHLAANLGFGALFSYLLGQLIGPGAAWASILAAAAAGNLLDALLMPASHRVIGASTAVFATLGLLAAYAWRRRASLGGRWPYRWAPLIAAAALLALTGTGGERTDVLGHLTGFFSGVLLGTLYGGSGVFLPGRTKVEPLAGAAALIVLAAAWALALQETLRVS
jgi:rhomboid protease GluP